MSNALSNQYQQRVDKYAQENTNRIEGWYAYADVSLKQRVDQGIQNLINIGFSDKESLRSRIYEHYSTGNNMDPHDFIFNFSFFYDNYLEKDFRLMQQELLDLCPPELEDDIEIPNEILIEALTPILEGGVLKIEKQYPELESSGKSPFKKKYPKLAKGPKSLLNKLLEHHIGQAINSISGELKYFHKKVKTEDLDRLFKFLKKHKILPDTLTIDCSAWGIGYGKDSEDIFLDMNDDIGDSFFDYDEKFILQVNEEDIVQGTDNGMLEVMFIFKEKALRDKLVILLKDTNKSFKTSNQKRYREDNDDSYYIECELDWRTF